MMCSVFSILHVYFHLIDRLGCSVVLRKSTNLIASVCDFYGIFQLFCLVFHLFFFFFNNGILKGTLWPMEIIILKQNKKMLIKLARRRTLQDSLGMFNMHVCCTVYAILYPNLQMVMDRSFPRFKPVNSNILYYICIVWILFNFTLFCLAVC